jgi:hypothetical protein
MRLRAVILILLLLGVVVSIAPGASAHRIRRLTAWSICHYEERYFVWTPREPWKVWGRVKPAHNDRRVVLQRSKRGVNWRKWKASRTNENGYYEFNGTARRRARGWWVLLRVVMSAQKNHRRVVSKSMYIDQNPSTRCG